MAYVNQVEITNFINSAQDKIAALGLIIADRTQKNQNYNDELYLSWELSSLIDSLQSEGLDWDEVDVLRYIHYYNNKADLVAPQYLNYPRLVTRVVEGLGASDITSVAVVAANAVVIGVDGSRLVEGSLVFIDADGNITNAKSLNFNTAISPPAHAEGLLWYDQVNKTLALYNDESDVTLQIGQEMWFRAKNNTGVTINNGEVVYINGNDSGTPTIALADASALLTSHSTIGVATHDIEDGTIGLVTESGAVRDLDTSSFSDGDVVNLSDVIPGGFQKAVVESPGYNVKIGTVTYAHASEGTLNIDVNWSNNTGSVIKIFNGAELESVTVDVTSNGSVITLGMEKSGGGDINFFFNGEFVTFDSTPKATIALTAGSDVSPTLNFIYVLESSGLLTVSTSGWPATQHAPIATVLVQSAASVQADGPYKVHAWADHVSGTDDMGHISHVNYWIRQQNATWLSGVLLSYSDGVATFDVAVGSGNILQLHEHGYPAFDTATGSDIYIPNDFTTAYKKVGDLTGETTDSQGVTMAGNWYNLVIWGVVNEASGDCKIMCNLPSGSYNNNNANKAINDDDQFSLFDIPTDFIGVGFLIARLTVQESGGTFTVQNQEDLRGLFPSASAGGGATGGNEFLDSVFRIQDDVDSTKEIAFQASTIATATVRTITMPDANVDLGAIDKLTPAVSALTDGAAIAFNLGLKYFDLKTLSTVETAITLTLSNIVAGANHILSVKKTNAADTTITLAGAGLTFYGYNGADYNTTPDVVLVGAAGDVFDISFLARSATEIGVALGEKGN